MASFTRVSVDEMKFTPAHVEIVRGTSVRWEQSPKCVVRHCLEVVDPEENNQASSPALLPGEPWEHTFEACGDFHYRSLVYCFMKGTVKVVDAPPADVDADRADAPVKTRAIAVDAVDATAAPASAAASSSSRDETRRVPKPLFDDECVAAAEYAAEMPPRIGSPTANDPKPEPATTARDRDRLWHACDRCARVFVSSTNLKRHVASHGNRRSSRNASARSRRPKPPPASVDEIAAFFAGLSSEKKREALAAVSAPGSTGALVVHGIRARKRETRDGQSTIVDRQSREGAREMNPAVAYAAAGAAVAKVVESYSNTHETTRTITDSTITDSTITDSHLFDALAGASEGTCFGPRADVDPTTMCLDENLDAALAYCVEQALFVSYLEERSAEAEAARKTLLAEIDEQCAEEERRAARRAEARKAKKAKSRSARPRMSGGSGISETETVSETEEARALANAAIESSRSDDGDDDRGGTVVPGGSRALSNASTPPPRETKRETQTRRTEVPGGSPAAEAVQGARRRGRTDFRGDSAKGDGATPTPLSAPRTTAPADAASAEKQKQKQNGNQKSIGNARPTTAPPSYHPPPNLPSASVAARRSPLAVPAPRRAASLASSSAAAFGDANDDAIVRPRLEPASRFAPPKADGDAEKASVVSASAPRKSRRALKAARASARAEGDAEASASATEVESASGSDFGYKTASDTDFSSGRSRVASRVSSAAPSRNAEGGGAESSTRRARSAARTAVETANANASRIAENLAAVAATTAGVQYPTSAARAPRNGSSRPAAADFEDARFASPAGTPATPVAMFASPPSAARAIPVAPVWSPERETARMATHAPPAFAPSMFPAVGAAGPIAPGGVMPLGHFPSVLHPMHHPPPGVDMEVYMHHYATALAAIQASQAVAARPGPAPFAPPLPPGPPPRSSRVREDF